MKLHLNGEDSRQSWGVGGHRSPVAAAGCSAICHCERLLTGCVAGHRSFWGDRKLQRVTLVGPSHGKGGAERVDACHEAASHMDECPLGKPRQQKGVFFLHLFYWIFSPPVSSGNKTNCSEGGKTQATQAEVSRGGLPSPSSQNEQPCPGFLWYLHLKEEERAKGSQRGEGERGEPEERQPGGSYSLFLPYFPLISLQSSLADPPSAEFPNRLLPLEGSGRRRSPARQGLRNSPHTADTPPWHRGSVLAGQGHAAGMRLLLCSQQHLWGKGLGGKALTAWSSPDRDRGVPGCQALGGGAPLCPHTP